MAVKMSFRNTAGAIKQQAVALRVQSDRSVFINCHMDGYQNTLYAQTHRQFYRACTIFGTIDFVFGDATAILQNCVLVIRRPLDDQHSVVTAQGRVDRHENTGFVLHRCRIIPDKALELVADKFQSYLGRPWKEYSRVVIMESEIGGVISPQGYVAMQDEFGLKTLSYAEYENYGPGSDFKARVQWPGVHRMDKVEAMAFTVAYYLEGGTWITQNKTGVEVPVRMGLYS